MDALVALQYRYLLGVLAIALAAGALAWLVLSRRRASARPAPDDTESSPPDAVRGVLTHVMLLLVALAVGSGMLLLVPAGMILRYFPSWKVDALLVLAAAILVAPLAYAWRARPRR